MVRCTVYFENGVHVGNIPSIKNKLKKTGTGMAWFPKGWSVHDMVKAGENVSQAKGNRNKPDGVTMWGTYKGVRIGVKKTNGQIATIFPDSKYQPKPGRNKKK